MGYLNKRIGVAATTANRTPDGTGGGIISMKNHEFWQKTRNIANISGTSDPLSLSGGNVTNGITPGNGYRYFVFTGPGTLSATGGPGTIDFLIVGGGGAGGIGNPGPNGNGSGGGGAGGIAYGVNFSVSSGNYTVTVGPGGSPGGNNGGDSSIAFPTPIVGKGGGYGGYDPGPAPQGNTGGSGGGGAARPGIPTGTGPANQPLQNPGIPQITNYGNAGGDGVAGSGYWGNGGGAGGSGAPGPGGNAGPGQAFPAFAYPLISPGIPVPVQPTFGPAVGPTGLYGGGGAASGFIPFYSPGNPGPGGGGAAGSPGITNTGGGGGGGSNPAPTPGTGAPGIILVRVAV